MSDVEARKQELMTRLKAMPNKDDRLRYIVDQGKALPELPAALKLDQFLIKGCISQAWLLPQIQGDRLHFLADSEAMIVKGIIALLTRVYNGGTAEEILAVPPSFLGEAGVTEHLSMNRRNGLTNILGMIRLYAERMQNSGLPERTPQKDLVQ